MHKPHPTKTRLGEGVLAALEERRKERALLRRARGLQLGEGLGREVRLAPRVEPRVEPCRLLALLRTDGLSMPLALIEHLVPPLPHLECLRLTPDLRLGLGLRSRRLRLFRLLALLPDAPARGIYIR